MQSTGLTDTATGTPVVVVEDVHAGYLPGVNILNGCDLYVGDDGRGVEIEDGDKAAQDIAEALLIHYDGQRDEGKANEVPEKGETKCSGPISLPGPAGRLGL